MKLHLRYLAIGLSLLLPSACLKEKYSGYYNSFCKNPDTGVQVLATDYETGVPLSQQRFELLLSSTTTWFGSSFVLEPQEEWTTDIDGKLDELFTHDPFWGATYNLRHLTDSTYYATQWWGVPVGCDHQYKAVLKKAFDLPVTVRNASSGTILNFSLDSGTLPDLNPASGGVALPLTHVWPASSKTDLAPDEVRTLSARALPDERLLLTWRFGRNGLPVVLSDSLRVSATSSFNIVIR